MLNRNSLFDAMSGISDDYLASAAVLLGDMKEDNLMHLDSSRNQAGARKAGRILLIAAVLVCLFTVTAFAAGLFSISTRVPDAKETFQIHWDDSENGYLEWSDAKLVLTFPAVAESREIEFRPGWLPFDLPEELPGSAPWNGIDKDTWFRRFASESLCWSENEDKYPEEYRNIGQPILIEAYSMAQFNDGGAMLMLYQTPENVTEEHWDEPGVDVLSFHGKQHFEERDIPELNMHIDAYDLEYDYVLLSNEEKGWIIEVCGQLGMDTVRKVAENLEIRETGNTLTQADFQNKYLFIDGGVG